MVKKFFSRKFLMAVGALVVATVSILKPGAEEQATQMVDSIVEGVLLIAPTVYIIIEGMLDKEGVKNAKENTNN